MPIFPAYITATIAPRSRYIVGTPGSATLQVFAEAPLDLQPIQCAASVTTLSSVGIGADLSPTPISCMSSISSPTIPSVSTTFQIQFYGPGAWIASGLKIYADDVLVGSGSDWGYPLEDPYGLFYFSYNYNEYDRYRIDTSKLPFNYSSLRFEFYAYMDQYQSPWIAYFDITALTGGAVSAPQYSQSQSDWPRFVNPRPDPRLSGKHVVDMTYHVDTKTWSQVVP